IVTPISSLRCSLLRRASHAFPTRRSSDLLAWAFAGSKLSSKSSACAAVPLTSAAQGAARRISEPITVQGPSPQDRTVAKTVRVRSEEHTSELQSRENLVCRLLLEKKKQ